MFLIRTANNFPGIDHEIMLNRQNKPVTHFVNPACYCGLPFYQFRFTKSLFATSPRDISYSFL